MLSAKLLERLNAMKEFLPEVKLFAGASTGGILALSLARGVSPTDMVRMYREQAAQIFGSRDALDALTGRADELFRADYDNRKGLRRALSPYFGEGRLADLERRVLVATVDLSAPRDTGPGARWKAKFLHNYPGETSDGDVTLMDAALRTTAAPTYFPSHQGFVDGGLVANNPSMCAVAKAIKEGVLLEEIVLLSVGTGESPRSVEGERVDWGKTQWATNVLDLVFDCGLGVGDYQCQQLLGDRYRRIQIDYEEPIALDAIDRVDDLIEVAEAARLEPFRDWLRRMLGSDSIVA